MTYDQRTWLAPGLTPRQRAVLLYEHYAPTSTKYKALLEALEATIQVAVEDAETSK